MKAAELESPAVLVAAFVSSQGQTAASISPISAVPPTRRLPPILHQSSAVNKINEKAAELCRPRCRLRLFQRQSAAYISPIGAVSPTRRLPPILHQSSAMNKINEKAAELCRPRRLPHCYPPPTYHPPALCYIHGASLLSHTNSHRSVMEPSAFGQQRVLGPLSTR